MAQPATPGPESPPIPSCASHQESASLSVSASSGPGEDARLRIPDKSEEESGHSVAREVAAPNPFQVTIEDVSDEDSVRGAEGRDSLREPVEEARSDWGFPEGALGEACAVPEGEDTEAEEAKMVERRDDRGETTENYSYSGAPSLRAESPAGDETSQEAPGEDGSDDSWVPEEVFTEDEVREETDGAGTEDENTCLQDESAPESKQGAAFENEQGSSDAPQHRDDLGEDVAMEEKGLDGVKDGVHLYVQASPGDDQDYETNSDWDYHDEVARRLDEYRAFKQSITGHESWTPQQAKLHKLIALRGSWPMLRRDWAFNFRTRNIYPWVYAPEGSRKRVAINARLDQFRAAKSLEALFDLSSLTYSHRQMGTESRIGPVVKRALERHIAWAMRDAGLRDRAYLPTLQVYEFDPAAVDGGGADEAAPAEGDGDPGPDHVSDEVERRLRALAAEHRRHLALPAARHLPEGEWAYRAPPPLLFAFVVLQHMVMIVTLDASHPGNEIIVFSEVDMSAADQWLWNALAITLPVQVARDALWNIRDTLPLIERMDVDDPDL